MTARLAQAADLVYRIIASTRVAAAVMLSWLLLLLVWIIPFVIYGVPASRIRGMIYGEPFFLAVYVALLVSTVACILPRTLRVLRRARRIPRADVTPRFPSDASITRASQPMPRVAHAVQKAGLRHAVSGDGWIWAVRNRWSTLGTLLFHLSFLVLALAVGVTMLSDSAFSGEFVLTEGEIARIDADQYISSSGEGEVPSFEVGVVSINPRFHEDVLLFTKLEAILDTPSGQKRVSVGNPWHPDLLTNVALTDFGWSLQLTSETSQGDIDTYVYDLKVFPSGTQDRLEITVGNDGYVVDVRIFGDYVDRDGQPGSRSFNADNPRILLSVWRSMTNGEDKLLIDSQLFEPGDSIDVAAGVIRVDEVLSHGVFTATRDPGRVLFLVALIMALTGTTARLILPRTELMAWEADGQVSVYARSDVYGRQPQMEDRVITNLNRRR